MVCVELDVGSACVLARVEVREEAVDIERCKTELEWDVVEAGRERGGLSTLVVSLQRWAGRDPWRRRTKLKSMIAKTAVQTPQLIVMMTRRYTILLVLNAMRQQDTFGT